MGRRSFPPLISAPSAVFLFPRLMLLPLPASPSPDRHSLQTCADMCPCVVERRKVTVFKVCPGPSLGDNACIRYSLSSQRRPSCSTPPPPFLSHPPPPPVLRLSSQTREVENTQSVLLTRKRSMGQASRGCDTPQRVRDLDRSAPPTKPSVDSNRLDAYRALAWTLRHATDVLGNDPSTFSTLLRLA